MKNQYVLSNIHGYLRSFNQLLSDWEPEEETLVIAGNVIDYGHNSFLVCQKLLELLEAYPERVIFLKGKHEFALERFLRNPALLYPAYIEEGGLATILSFHEDGLSYDEINDRYYMLDAVLPETDFTEIEAYIASSVSRYETDTSIFLSYGNELLEHLLPSDKHDFRTLFLASDQDPRFKLHYLNHYLPEKLVRDGTLTLGDLNLFQNRYVLLGKDPSGWTEAYSWGHHIESGKVTEVIQVPAED